MNNSLPILLDNIHVLKVRDGISTYKQLSDHTGINENTLKSWFSSKSVFPKLSMLDKLSDSFQINTSELFIPKYTFPNKYTKKNHSRQEFIYNFRSICIEMKLFSYEEMLNMINHCISKASLISYLRMNNGRTAPIDTLDLLANKLNICTYQLLKPKEA